MPMYHFYSANVIDAGSDYYHFDSFFMVVIQPAKNIPIEDHMVIVYATTDDPEFPNITDERVRRELVKSLKTTIPLETHHTNEIIAVEKAIRSVYKHPATFLIKKIDNS